MSNGIFCSAPRSAPDLGASTDLGAHRAVSARAGRFAKADIRAQRARRLLAADRRAKKLFRAGALAMDLFGAADQGTAPSMVRASRR